MAQPQPTQATDDAPSRTEPNFENRSAGLHPSLVEDWLSVLLSENKARIEKVDENFQLYINTKSVEYTFTICLRLRLPQDIKYMALEIYNKFMVSHLNSLWKMVYEKTGLSGAQKKQEWEKIFTTVSRQITLRTLSCIQIASKLHTNKARHMLSIEKVQACLQLLGYAYTEESIRKSELRVLNQIGWCGNAMQTPVIYLETFLDVIYKMNSPTLVMNSRALWEYSLLIMDCVFLRSEEVYKRIVMVIHGEAGMNMPEKRLKRLQADYALLASGVIIMACICVHGTDFVSTVICNLSKTTGIPTETIRDFYLGIYQAVHDHEMTVPTDSCWAIGENNLSQSQKNESAIGDGGRKTVTFLDGLLQQQQEEQLPARLNDEL